MFNGYNWREWQELEYEDRVDGVAHMRLSHIIKLVQNEIEIQHSEQQSAAAMARSS